jgi:hypothetical protein
VTTPADRVRAILGALAAGDEQRAHDLAHGDPHPGCTSLEASRWVLTVFQALTNLEGGDFGRWWAETAELESLERSWWAS